MSVEYSMIDNEWINVPARLSKRRKGKRQFLHPEAIEHINRIRSERAIILAWPQPAWIKQEAKAESHCGGSLQQRLLLPCDPQGL